MNSYKISKKDKLIDELKHIIMADSAWLTPNDIHAIEAKIDELDYFINERYNSHGH